MTFSRVWEVATQESVIEKQNWKNVLTLADEEDGSWVQISIKASFKGGSTT